MENTHQDHTRCAALSQSIVVYVTPVVLVLVFTEADLGKFIRRTDPGAANLASHQYWT